MLTSQQIERRERLAAKLAEGREALDRVCQVRPEFQRLLDELPAQSYWERIMSYFRRESDDSGETSQQPES